MNNNNRRSRLRSARPLVALNCDVDTALTGKVLVGRKYVQAILQAGGIPFPLAHMSNRELARVEPLVSGFLFIGGHDYSPSLYHERKHPSLIELHPIRQEFDVRLMKFALGSVDKSGKAKPILGICGGCQLLDIVLGGSLIQDIESARPGLGGLHKNPQAANNPNLAARHSVKLVSGSQLARIFRSGTIDQVISSHHQAVNRIGKNLSITGFSEDGIVEAVEHLTRPFTLGVQWHPEGDYSAMKPLFDAFIRRARQMDV